MTRHHPNLGVLAVAALLGGAAIVSASIVLTRPAIGDECRFQPCPLVRAVSASVPAGTYRVRRHYRPVLRMVRVPRDTLTAADRSAQPEMPLVWPVMEPEKASVSDGEGPGPSTLAVAAISSPSVTRRGEPSPAPWLHTDHGKTSVLVAFLAFVAALVGGAVQAEIQKRKPHERCSPREAFG